MLDSEASNIGQRQSLPRNKLYCNRQCVQRIKKRPQRGREYGFCWVSRSLPGKYVCSKEGVISFRELFDLGKGCVAGQEGEL